MRFKQTTGRAAALAAYLIVVHQEATRRGYNFDATKIAANHFAGTMPETSGQLLYEWNHLNRKLEQRAPDIHKQHLNVVFPVAHPLFQIVEGDVRDWKRTPE